MGFWLFMLLSDLLIPLITIVFGWLMWKHYPKKINSFVGYRTVRFMKNMDTWQFAHKYCGRLWWKLGWMILFPSALVQILLYPRSEQAIGLIGSAVALIQCVILILSILPTENALKRTFNEDGTQKYCSKIRVR